MPLPSQNSANDIKPRQAHHLLSRIIKAFRKIAILDLEGASYYLHFAATRSANIKVARFVFAEGIVGIIDASTTCRPVIRWTLPSESTTTIVSLAGLIRQVPTGCIAQRLNSVWRHAFLESKVLYPFLQHLQMLRQRDLRLFDIGVPVLFPLDREIPSVTTDSQQSDYLPN